MRTTFFILAFLFGFTTSFAQEGSLGGETTARTPGGNYIATVPATSLTFMMPPEAKTYKVNDLIQVRIVEEQEYSNTLNNQRKRSIKATSRLTGFFTLGGLFGLRKMQADELPEVGGEIDMKYQNNGNMSRKESFTKTIGCRVKTVYENNTMLIEGTRSMRVGEEMTKLHVSGIVRPEDIDATNAVESTKLVDYEMEEMPEGQVYDTGRRPWGTRLLEHWFPF